MLCKRLLLFIFFITSFTKAFSAIFVVTSNADSGPGTLREALTLAAANGSGTTDYINFNLADQSVAGRTIMLITQLPDLSPNLVIDGTTQPGVPFGVSDAKVQVFDNFLPPSLTPPYVFKGQNLGNFTISGLWLNALTYNGQNNVYGVEIDSTPSVTITHCLMPEGNIDINNCDTFICQSNLIGYLPDGITAFPTKINVRNVFNVVIGGTIPEGNLLSGAVNLNMDILDKDWTYTISNNKLGTDYSGTTSSLRLYSDYGRIDIESGHYNPPSTGKMHGTISNNLIENFSTTGIVVSGFGDVAIKGNAIGTDRAGKTDFTQFEPPYGQNNASTGIVLQVGIDAIVGGDDSGDKNTIGYVGNGILEQLANHVTISKNSIYCLNRSFFNTHDFVTQAYAKPLPLVQISTITNNSISGTATPGARVELFSNSEGQCLSCDPRNFFRFVTADAQGNWSYAGLLPANIVASAIYNGQTSLFTKAKVVINNLKITQPRCGDNSGAIEGMQFYNAGQIRWVDQSGKVVSNTLNVNNLPPGKYKFKVGTNVCGAESDWIELFDNSIKIDAAKIEILQPACNKGGAVSGLVISSYKNEAFTSAWTDDAQKQVGNTTDVSDLLPGKYTLTVIGKTTGCSKSYGPVELIGVSGPALDLSNYKLQFSGCDTHSGFVKGLKVTGTGTLKFSWTNEQQQEVATTLDLTDQPAGTYTLHVSDDSQCDPVIHQFVIEDIVGVKTSTGNEKITAATCGEANGSITGFSVIGASHYKWTNAKGETVGDKVDLTGVRGGDYQITVSDNCGHQLTSGVYHIDQQDKTTYPNYNVSILNICPGSTTGGISITTDALVKSVRWVNSSGQTVGTLPGLPDVGAGTYQLYLTDQNGCESLYKSYMVDQITPLAIQPASVKLVNDHCSSKQGSITNIIITGGKLPYNYTWTDAGGNVIATSPSLSGLAAGDYTLSVSDATSCNYASASYTIVDENIDIEAPSAGNLQVCAPGNAFLIVNNPSPGYTYRLYSSESSTTPIAETETGKFNINVQSGTMFYVSSSIGSCESSRTAVNVTIGISALNIPNAFSPNGDGINDFWNIPGLENIPSAIVQVYTRYGQKVFESRGYDHPFDGNSNGKALPTGVYYYIINPGTNCNILSGNLTIIR